MESLAPNFIEEALEAGQARIGVGTLAFTDKFNGLTHWILTNALTAALAHAEIKPSEKFSYHRPFYSVTVAKIPWEARGAAADSLKNCVKELGLEGSTLIAISTADGVWLNVHGPGKEFVKFETAFLQPSEIIAYQRDWALEKERSQRSWDEMFRALEAAAKGENNDHQK